MEGFITPFLAIDKDGSGSITPAEIREYAISNNLDPSMAQKWQAMFDPDNTGHITLEKFCDVLGLQLAQVEEARREMVHSQPGLGPDVKVLAFDMSMPCQIEVSDETKRLYHKIQPFDGVRFGKELKEFLDAKYGPCWHVVVAKGSYWVQCQHVPARSFHFMYEDHLFSVWQTGADF